jgi:hypothetical protein
MASNIRLLLIAMCIVIILISAHYVQVQEHFLPQLSFIVDEKPDVLPVYIDKHVYNKNILSIKNVSKNILITENDKQYTFRITDAFSALQNQPHNNIFVGAFDKDKVSVVIVSPVTYQKKWNSDKFVIGYSTDIQHSILKTILNSLKSNHNITLKKVIDSQNTRNTMTDVFFQHNNIDALCCFESIGNIKINKNFKLQVIDYAEDVDMQKLFVLWPYAHKTVFDFSLVFQQLKGKRDALKSIISFDTIVVTNKKIEVLNVQRDIVKTVKFLNTPAKTNFYQMFMPTLFVSRAFARRHDNFIKERDSLQILEQFTQGSKLPTITCSSSIHGFFDIIRKKFTVFDNKIDGLELAIGMIIIMKHQDRSYENGQYVVEHVDDTISILHQSFPDMRTTTKSYSFVCYGDQSIKSKALCDSVFDEIGTVKRKKTYWDRPCTTDIECPFFQANKNYQNYRGGCVDGRCEMPIGIQSVSFQKYDPKSKPVCHGCKDKSNPYCCEEQKQKRLYPMLKSPDYAFEIDYFERLNS